ncbi:MAG: glutathione-disulfide reductase [Pseudomonadota bacterium]
MAHDFDLFVIGGGSGGVRAARVAAAEGAKVGLAEESRMGGTCVIRGCVPKKLMVFASSYRGAMEDAQHYGWDVQPGAFDWPNFRTKLEAELDRLERLYQGLLDGSGVTWYPSRAVLKDPHTIELADGQRFTAKTILVATGGHPFVPDELPSCSGVITSNDVFHLDHLPESILIVGGGYIACEFACILNGLGVEVTQFYRGAQVLRGFDDEARGLVATEMQNGGIRLHTGTNPVAVEERENGCWVKATDGSHRVYNKILFATGRVPNSRGMGLEELGVEIGRRGEIKVDAYSQTTVPSIYAIGDVTNRVNLTPVAIREGMAFVETVIKNNPTSPDHDLIPSAVFTQPELGTIGLTEEEARDQEPIDVYCSSFKPMQQSFAGRDDRVLMKLIVSQETRKVLGCHIVAPSAGEMIQLAGVAVKMGATKEDFDRTVAVHPTMAEELVTMKAPMRSA